MFKVITAILLFPAIALAQAANTPTLVVAPTLKCVDVTPTVEAAAYAAGDCLHASAIAVAGAARVDSGSGKIVSVVVSDKQGQGKNMTAVFFEASPSTICAAINGAFDPADADLLNIVGGAPISINAHDAFSDNGVSWAVAPYAPFKLDSGTSLYMALIAEEAVTPAVGDYSVKVCVERD
jgi:hypothetical protein